MVDRNNEGAREISLMSLTDASLSTFSERSRGVLVSNASPFHDANAVGMYKVDLIEISKGENN